MTILQEIVSYKEELLNHQYYDQKLLELDTLDVKYKTTLNSAFSSDKLAIIAELKAKSPSVGDIPKRDMAMQLKLYETYGASAISILTDEKYFGGSFELMHKLSSQTSLPILCKDFIIDEVQIDLAKKAGASIVLLIVNILTDIQLKRLYDYATSMGLEVIVEVHDEQELNRACAISPKIIGINNRDLKTFNVDVCRTVKILNKQSGVHYITESGIRNKEDLQKILKSGIDGALIGEALMRNPERLADFKLEKQNVR